MDFISLALPFVFAAAGYAAFFLSRFFHSQDGSGLEDLKRILIFILYTWSLHYFYMAAAAVMELLSGEKAISAGASNFIVFLFVLAEFLGILQFYRYTQEDGGTY